MKIIERFIILMYDKTSQCPDIDKARRKMFAKRLKAEQIPPTFDALEQHLTKAVYQGIYGHRLSSRSQFYLHQQDGDGPQLTVECMYLN